MFPLNSFQTDVSYYPLISLRLQMLTWPFSTLFIWRRGSDGGDDRVCLCLFSPATSSHSEHLKCIFVILDILRSSSPLHANLLTALTQGEKVPGLIFAIVCVGCLYQACGPRSWETCWAPNWKLQNKQSGTQSLMMFWGQRSSHMVIPFPRSSRLS